MPVNLQLTLKNSTVSVSWTAQNRAATYVARAMGVDGVHNCTTSGSSCDITDFPCGSTYEISVTANSTAGQSLPSYTDVVETGKSSKLQVDYGVASMTPANVDKHIDFYIYL